MKRKYDDKVLDVIKAFWFTNCYPPTVRDVMKMCDIPSTSHTASIFRRLALQGHIELRGNAHPIPCEIISILRAHA